MFVNDKSDSFCLINHTGQKHLAIFLVKGNDIFHWFLHMYCKYSFDSVKFKKEKKIK